MFKNGKVNLRRIAAMLLMMFLVSVFIIMPINTNKVSAAVQATYYVSTTGSDTTGDGSIGNPYATIQKARDVVRATKGSMTGDIIVYIRGGKYYQNSAISFNENDSGNNGYRIYYKNYTGETPEIAGSQQITGWALYSGSIYRAYVGTTWKFYTLFENGERVTTARYPNTGYNTVESGFAAPDDKKKFVYRPGDLPTFTVNNTQVCIFSGGDGAGYNYDFFMDIAPVASVNTSTRTITLGVDTAYSIAAGNRYFVRGAYAFLDQAGEFFLDETAGYLYYWPKNTPIDNQVIVAPKTKRLIELQGSSTSNPVQYITFEGLTLTQTDSVKTFDSGYDYNMADVNTAIYMKNALYNAVKNCVILNVGFDGVILDKYAQYNTIYGNIIQNMGHHGVFLCGWDSGTGGANATEAYAKNTNNNTISNNFIMDSGQITLGGNGIGLYQSGDNEISYNEMRRIPKIGVFLLGLAYYYMEGQTYYGIPCTYANHWDFLFTRNNNIKLNDFYDCLTENHDIGLIDAFGTGKYNIIDNNRVHDSTSSSGSSTATTVGIYLDNGADYFTVKNNIIYGIYGTGNYVWPVTNHGSYNTWTNNISADNSCSLDMQFWEYLPDEGRHNTVTKNIFHQDSLSTIYKFTDCWVSNTTIDACNNNVYYHPGAGTLQVLGIPGAQTYANWRTIDSYKYDQNSSTADPLFDPAARANHIYTVQAGSPALALGFVNIDQSTIGLKTDFPYTILNNDGMTYNGTWGTYTYQGYYKTEERSSNTTGNYYQFSFVGTNAKIYSEKGYSMGKADVYVDDMVTPAATIDLYSPVFKYNQLYFDTGTLANGNHTVRIKVKGEKNPSSTDYWVSSDMAIITGGDTTVDFESRGTADQALTGVYPTGGIDWGSSDWRTSYYAGLTVYAYVNNTSTVEITRTFTLPAGKVLKSLKLCGQAGATNTVKVSQPGNTEITWTNIPSSNYNTYTTGWTSATGGTVTVKITCTHATYGASGIIFDDIVYGTAGDTTVDFESRGTSDQALTGVYPTGGIDWGSSDWRTSYYAGLTVYAYVNNTSTVEITRTFTLPAGKVLKSLKLCGQAGATNTVKVSQPGNTEITWTNIPSSNYNTYTTGWTSATGSTVTVKITCTHATYGASGIIFDDITY